MINVEEIKKKISEAIKYSGRTQVEIAKAIGVSQQMISNYLKGAKTPQIETLANLCATLDLDANEILCIDQLSRRTNYIDQRNNKGTINNSF